MKTGTAVVLCPMDCEFEYLASRLSDKREKHICGYIFCEGMLNGLPVVVIRCLMGTVNAAVCASMAIERYSPACVILQGTSGAHDPDLKTNDIVIAKNMISLTNVVSPRRKAGEGTNPFEWEGFGVQAYSKKDDLLDFVNEFHCDERLIELASSVPYPDGNVKIGTVGCGDVWNREADLILFYHRTRGTDCEAMEGVGAAQICAAYDVPMLEIRVISNSELRENERFSIDTAQSCQKFVYDMLIKISEEGI